MAEETKSFANQPQFPDRARDEGAPGAGNRPASGARQVSPGEVLSQEGFQGSATAGDFLGLDLEFIGSSGASSDLDLTGLPRTGEAALEDDDLDDFGGDVAAGDLPGDDAGLDEELGAGGLDQPLGEHIVEPLEPSFDEPLEPLLEERGGRSKLLIGGGLLLAAGVAAYFFVPQFFSKDAGIVTTQVAQKDKPKPAARSSEPAHAADPVPAETPTPIPIEQYTNTSGEPETPTDELPPAGGDEQPTDLLGGIDVLFGGQPTTPEPDGDATSAVASVMGLGQTPPPVTGFPDFDQGFEWVSDDMLDMVWRGTDVPMEAIAAPARTLMPRVGLVRLYMTSGEVFEGRLYAVGQNMVWLETQPGRVGLDGSTVSRFEHLPVEAGANLGGNLPAGDMVRVRVPGGVMDGRILSQEGTMVTLLTEDGAKVTLLNATVEPLIKTRAKVVQR